MKQRRIDFEYKILLAVILVVIVIWGNLVYSIATANNDELDSYLSSELEAFQAKVVATLQTYELFSNYIYNALLNNEDVLQIMYEAGNAGEPLKSELRIELYEMLKDDYALIENYDFRQLHFHLPNTESFLRFHRPERYGDLLWDIRKSVQLANTEKRYVSGFEEGRIYNGYRFVYPLSYHGSHVGTVEVSISIASLMEVLNHLYPDTDTYFMLEKEVIAQKVFESELENYIPSDFSDAYLYDVEVNGLSIKNNNLLTEEAQAQLTEKLRDAAVKPISSKESFSLHEKVGDQTYLIQFYAIKNIENTSVGYFISVSENNQIDVIFGDLYGQLWLVSLVIVIFIGSSSVFASYQVRIKRLSQIDPLTQLYNRRMFNRIASMEWSKCRRYGQRMSILMFDIDHFKRVNDTYGHSEGDAVLKNLSRIVGSEIRDSDLLARWGGEEFICMLPSTEVNNALIVAEKLRSKVEGATMGKAGSITISVGVAQCAEGDQSIENLINRADKALYKAKNTGRNRVCSYVEQVNMNA